MTAPADTTEAAFLARIIDNTEDDLPRTVFADWLDENGQPERAEFIRIQCRLACHCPPLGPVDRNGIRRAKVCENCLSLTPSGRDTLRRRERELIRNNWDTWCPWMIPTRGYTFRSDSPERLTVLHGDGVHIGVKFSRGFVSHVTASLEVLFGGECPLCTVHWDGIRIDDGSRSRDRCIKGRTPGIAANLFRVAPVEGVRVSGRRPFAHPSPKGTHWYWSYPGWGEDRADVLPMDLFLLIEGDDPEVSSDRDSMRGFLTPELAFQALSFAAVKMGRQRASGQTAG